MWRTYSQQSMNLRGLLNGVYHVKVTHDGVVYFEKLI